jgi:hypothetical protein
VSQAINISDELDHKLAEQAKHHGQPVYSFVEEQLAAVLEEPLATPEDEEGGNTTFHPSARSLYRRL